MVTAFDDDVRVLAAESPGQSQRRHDGLGARIGKAHQLGGRHHLRNPLRNLVFGLGRQREDSARFHALAGGLVNARVGVPQDAGTVTHAVVDVLVAVQVPEAGAGGAIDVYGPVFAPVAKI